MDINTIFYFPGSLTFEEYVLKLNSGEISQRTIVFADSQKSVYKGGKKYGGISEQEFRNLIDSLYGDSWISDELNDIKANVSDSLSRANQFDAALTELSERLDEEIQERGDIIQSKIEQLMEDSQWIQLNFPQGVTQWNANWDSELERYLLQVGYWTVSGSLTVTLWSKLQQSINLIESSVNSLKQDGNLTQALTASIQQLIEDDIASLNLDTSYASTLGINDVQKIIEWLYSGLHASSSEDKTFAQMQSMSKNDFTSAISEIRTQVERVKNGDFVATSEISTKVGNAVTAMLQLSSNDNALAELAARLDLADALNAANISEIVLGVTGQTSTADISTSILNAMSGFASSSDVSTDIASAKSEIYSAIGAKDNNDNFISIAALKTYAEENRSTISAITNNGNNTSGFITESNLGSSVAQIFASSGDGQNSTAKANVVALVRDNKSSLNLSANDVNITANDINLDGYLTGGSASFKGDVEATSFTTGSVDEVGIGVMSGEFNELLANTNKAYFAYDSSLGGITMWYYQNNEWKRLNLTDAAVLDSAETFLTYLYISLPDTSIDIFPSNPTVVTMYYNRVTGKYYSQLDTTSSLINGTYFALTGNSQNTVRSEYKDSSVALSADWACCCVKEHKADGTVVNSGLPSAESSYTVGVSVIKITNGVAEIMTGLWFNVQHVISDIYLDASGNITRAICAPVFVTPTNSVWSTTGSKWSFITAANGNYNYNCSTKVIHLNGLIRSASSSVPNCFVAAKRITLQEALNSLRPENYDYPSQRSTGTWGLSNTVPVKYPGDSGYPY